MLTIYHATYQPSPFGPIDLYATPQALCQLATPTQEADLRHLPQPYRLYETTLDEISIFREVKQWLDAYFKGEKLTYYPLLALYGTDFQKRVWQHLLQIPYGQLTTYGALAQQIAKEQGLAKMSARAVGGAVGQNPVPIIIPCHRVVGSTGKLTGYTGGLPIKISLLTLEKIPVNEQKVLNWSTKLADNT